MTYKVSITPLTFLDIDEAIFWYEKQLPGLGKQFLSEFDKCLHKIQEQPENYLLIAPPVRRILLKEFPCKLYYFVANTNEIVVLAVIHTKRSNRYVKQRLQTLIPLFRTTTEVPFSL